MKETITETYAEDAIADANDFMQQERGVGIDGAEATLTVTERVMSAREAAESALRAVPSSRIERLPSDDSMFVPLSDYNSEKFDEVRVALAGYMVLVPSSYVDRDVKGKLYPAVVSEDGLSQPDALRLHILKKPYQRGLSKTATVALSAAGQSEAWDMKKGTKVVGHHNHQGGDGVEAEHFATLLAAGIDSNVRSAWQNGQHPNHAWREQANNSVLSRVNNTILANEMPQQTVTFKKRHFEQGAMILWHEGLRSEETGAAETATKDQALVIVQAIGHEAIKSRNPDALDNVKRLLA